MQASAEISHKVRLAIKTKLTELGAYVDDELPDYVLVMVANRRGRQDMKKELELFLGEATDRFCSWLFGVLDKLKDAKKTAKDKRPSESENDAKEDKEDKVLEEYDEEEIERTKKKEPELKVEKNPEKKTDKRKKSEKPEKPEKESKSCSPEQNKKTKKTKSRSKSPLAVKKSRRKRRTKSQSRSRTRTRSKSKSRSRSPRRERSRDKKDRKRIKSDSPDRKKKKEKTRRRSPSLDASDKKKKSDPVQKQDKIEVEKREKSKKKKEAGAVKSSVVVPNKIEKVDKVEKKEKISVPKPTSNLIIRAINESAGTGKLGLTRSITVTPTNGKNDEKTATKRKSKSEKEEPEAKKEKKSKPKPEVTEKKVDKKETKNEKSDKRVFVTKKVDSIPVVETTIEKPGAVTKQSRPASPKFFVTLHEGDKQKEKTEKKKKRDEKDMIINPMDDSEDSDTIPENDISTQAAAIIKEQQEQNNAQLSALQNQSVNLNVGSLVENDPDSRTVFVSGLDWTLGEAELQEHFGIIGQIVRVTVLKDRFTGCSKGCAYIQYATVDQKKTACEAFDKTDFHSRKISVGEKLAPEQISNSYVARAAITAFPKSNYVRPIKDSKYSYVPGGAPARTKYQWTKPGFMPPR